MAIVDEEKNVNKKAQKTEAEVADAETVKEEDVQKDDGIIDIDLSATAKRKFRINGDNRRLVELNPSDLSIITRIDTAEKKLDACIKALQQLADEPSDDDDSLKTLGEKFSKIDDDMRELVDYIFQSNVSEVCVPKGQGSMYDPFNGKYRYEHIIEALLNFYQGNIQNEYKKMRTTVAKKTSKYTKKK